MAHRKSVTSKVLIDRLKSTFQIGHSNWINFALNELGYGIQLIGYHIGFKEVAIGKCVINNIAEYPSNLIGFKGIEYEGRRLPLVEDFTLVKLGKDIIDRTSRNTAVDKDDALELENLLQAYTNLVEYQLENNVDKGEEEVELIAKIRRLKVIMNLSNKDLDVNQYHGYYLNDTKILTTFESGDIIIYGTEIAIDAEGYPMIRDEANYIEACFWYVASKLMLQGYKNPNLSYGDALALFDTYKAKASNKGKMSLDKLENMKNMMTRYVHRVNYAESFFRGAEKSSQI
jgi:hypothetical protein